MKVHRLTAGALLGLGLLSGCAGMTNTACEEPREGFLTRWFGHRRNECPCVETGHVISEEGPVIAEPGCCSGCGAPQVGGPSFLTTPPVYTAPPGLPMPAPLAQPIPANPSSQVKDVSK